MSNKKFTPHHEDLKAWDEYRKTIKRIDRNLYVDTKVPDKPVVKGQEVSITSALATTYSKPKRLIMADFKDIDRNLAKQMDSGNLPIEGELDLHSKKIEEAYELVINFILASFSAGKRLLLIITGKGIKSPEGRSVLRDELPTWLNDKRISGMILRFNYASRKHGGEGAFYVLLRRRRNK